MLCPSCGSNELRSVAGDSGDVPQTEPRQRDVDKSVILVGTLFIIGVLWHIVWIASALFFFLAIRDLMWNTFTWPRRYAAWARLHECPNCGYIGPPEGLATAPADAAHEIGTEPPV
jgi:hypothetical protein